MKTITVDEAEEILDSDPVAVQTVSEHRWYTKELIVFQGKGRSMLQGFYYLRPASELQEDQERFESDPVKVFPVVSREVKTLVYEIVK